MASWAQSSPWNWQTNLTHLVTYKCYQTFLSYVTCRWGFCNSIKASLKSGLRWVRGANRSRTSRAICMLFDSTGWKRSSLPLLIILLWTLTRAFNSLDFNNSLRKPSSSSELGSSCRHSSSEDKRRDKAEKKQGTVLRLSILFQHNSLIQNMILTTADLQTRKLTWIPVYICHDFCHYMSSMVKQRVLSGDKT